jgi:hypothetical protein
MSGYQSQLARVRRFLMRIQTHNRSADDYDDDMWSFFQNCWHLKDWIKNDQNVPASVRGSIEGKVKLSPELLICADLANATKHLQLSTPRVSAKHSHKNYKIVVGESSSIEYFIDRGDGTRIEAMALARQCVTAWEAILISYGFQVDV